MIIDFVFKKLRCVHVRNCSCGRTRSTTSYYSAQGRFASFPMDNTHLYIAARSVELNPVRANMVKKPQEYRWSSASAHIAGRDDRLVHVAPLFEMFGEWDDFLSGGLSDEEVEKFRCHERTGRPLGADSFLARLENVLGRILHKQQPGPKVTQKKNRNL